MPLTTKEKEYIMTVSVHAHFSEEEREMLAHLADGLTTICHKMDCSAIHDCDDCPLNTLTDCAHNLGVEISTLLLQGGK